MKVDYKIYADGEALLGWLNATVQISAEKDFDGNKTVRAVAAAIQKNLKKTGGEVAHLKMTLDPDEGLGDIAVINLVRNDGTAEMSQELQDPLRGGELIINLRAEVAPEDLRTAVEAALEEISKEQRGLNLKLHHIENFRPGKPQPTHRIALQA